MGKRQSRRQLRLKEKGELSEENAMSKRQNRNRERKIWKIRREFSCEAKRERESLRRRNKKNQRGRFRLKTEKNREQEK